jgi:hypothetical protein
MCTISQYNPTSFLRGTLLCLFSVAYQIRSNRLHTALPPSPVKTNSK